MSGNTRIRMSAKGGKVRWLVFQLALLFLVLGLASPLWSQGEMDAGSVPTAVGSDLELTLSGGSPWCLTDTECSFSLVLPDIPPGQVGIGNPRLPEGVRFLAAHKDLWVEDGVSGTSIRVLLSFSQEGRIQLPPLDILVDGVLYQLPFAPVEVFQNPRSLQPQIRLSFQREDGQLVSLLEGDSVPAAVGQPLLLTVSLRYAAALVDFGWQLVPNALFQQTGDFREEFNRETGELSHQFQLVAEFSLIPLRQGALEVPPMELEVETYGGEIRRLSTAALQVQVAPASSHGGEQPDSGLEDGILASAFSSPPEDESSAQLEVSLTVATELAGLRWLERRGLPGSTASRNRISLERELGLEPGRAESSWLLVWGMAGLGGMLLTLSILFVVKRRFFVSAGLWFCLVLLLVVLLVYSRPLFRPTGILASQTLDKIPEESAASHFPVAPYSVVEIEQEVLGWYHVSATGLEGWIPCGKVVPIGPPSNAEQ